ncbi:MAG: hypothetical protein SGJ13_04170 [Actinomycetota bacterium]|nr:hypothetical protein [Actinomycetota bacterium]
MPQRVVTRLLIVGVPAAGFVAIVIGVGAGLIALIARRHGGVAGAS